MSRANILLFYLFVSVLAVFPDAKREIKSLYCCI